MGLATVAGALTGAGGVGGGGGVLQPDNQSAVRQTANVAVLQSFCIGVL